MSSVLLGGACGDSLGVFAEGLPPNHPALLEWDGEAFLPSRPRSPTYYGANIQLKPGQTTDDTVFSLCVAKSLIDNNGFNADDLSKRYVEAVFGDISRGYGRTTMIAVQALKEGKHWSGSGVQGSIGNGTAMRAAPFGVYFRDDLDALIHSVKIDSAITHVSDEAEAGALAIALAAYHLVNNDTTDMCIRIAEHLPKSQIRDKIANMPVILAAEIKPLDMLKILGTKARVQETVPSALYCLLKFDIFDNAYRNSVVTAIRAGGDTDTTAAIVGALCAVKCGIKGIPSKWVSEVEASDELQILDSKLFNRDGSSLFSV